MTHNVSVLTRMGATNKTHPLDPLNQEIVCVITSISVPLRAEAALRAVDYGGFDIFARANSKNQWPTIMKLH